MNLILTGLLATTFTHAASIQKGDVSSSLTGTIFLDEAATGGGDTTRHDGAGWKVNGIKTLAYGSGQAGTITISSFGFATNKSLDSNDATSIDLQFNYLGADGVPDTSDDVIIGTVSNIAFTYAGAGEYYILFGEESISAAIDGVNDQFQIWVKVNDLDAGLQESLTMKADSVLGTKMSISGSFEPGSASVTWAGYTVRPDGYVDTGSFLGFIWVSTETPSDWVWSVSLAKYIYMPEVLVSAFGGWAYVPGN